MSLAVACAAVLPTIAHAASREVRYGPPPRWVVPPPAATAAPVPPGAMVRVMYVDNQIRVTPQGEENYQAYRLRILTADALPAGNIAIGWAPAADDMTVHRLAIVRDGKAIDVLATQKFAILQRENGLEQAVLDGDLTATLQAAGLQVGDEIEFAATRRHRDPNLGDRAQGFMQFPVVGTRGSYRLRLIAPRDVAVKASDLPDPVETGGDGEVERRWELVDPDSVVVPDGAPPRYAIRRMAQYSGFGSWADLSALMRPMYDRATTIAPGSPLRAEVARIAAASTDPVTRAEAALALVQERIRYVYVGLDGGNYRPAGVDETWKRRFGDCKAKSALLVALLRDLGIAADPVLVNAATGGDGINERLPTPALFDHVVVRATIAGKPYWLDGTRSGDRRLAALTPPPSRWALAIGAGPAMLEKVATVPPAVPQMVQALDIDATPGFDKPARVRAQQTLRGDEVQGMRAQLAGLATADAERQIATYWRKTSGWIEPEKTAWRYDDATGALTLSVEGEGKPDWEGDGENGRSLDVAGAGFSPPAELTRAKDQDQSAPWATNYPRFTCWATTIRLPAAAKGRHWTYRALPVDRELGGVAYWRIAALDGGVMRTVMSARTLRPEITAMEARTVNASIKGFDNKVSQVFETDGTPPAAAATPAKGFGTFADYAGATPPCQAPVK